MDKADIVSLPDSSKSQCFDRQGKKRSYLLPVLFGAFLLGTGFAAESFWGRPGLQTEASLLLASREPVQVQKPGQLLVRDSCYGLLP